MTLIDPLFHPDRDPFQDLQVARARAVQENKNILIELGADWCVWCHRLDSFIRSHPDLHLLRSRQYVHVRVHVGDGETASEICRHLPAFEGIPHYFVYNAEGKLLHSQHTSLLEEGESYNYKKVWEFLAMWGDKGNQGLLQ